ncbi:hypothetical protein PUN28_004465 [Cardiocondyla obscurior]|uniref:Uncharacterized protein n=1 Tax=Cardiocondyla obscurior TaxID=286306 RepID=A0AAW2GBF3_9HYME
MLVARPSTFQCVTSLRQSDPGTRHESSSEPNFGEKKKKKERRKVESRSHCWFFISGASVSHKCALSFAPRYS